jgi:hypothetical protein
MGTVWTWQTTKSIVTRHFWSSHRSQIQMRMITQRNIWFLLKINTQLATALIGYGQDSNASIFWHVIYLKIKVNIDLYIYNYIYLIVGYPPTNLVSMLYYDDSDVEVEMEETEKLNV